MKMPKPHDSPRFATLVSAAGVFLLVLAGTYMVFHNERSYRQTKTEQVDAQAAILASTVAAALDFDDRKAAQEYIGALAADPEIREAAIYDARGQLFAGYSHEGTQPLPASVSAARGTDAGDRIAVTLPVRQGAATVGTVYLQTIIEPLSRRLERYARDRPRLPDGDPELHRAGAHAAHADARQRRARRPARRARARQRGAAHADRGARESRDGAAPVAEDGCHRPAHRRHRARFQQPAAGDHRQPRDAAAARRRPGRRLRGGCSRPRRAAPIVRRR